MTGDPTDQTLRTMFASWQRTAAVALPPPQTLTVALEKLAPRGTNITVVRVTTNVLTAKYFATAAIDIWQRAIHSLLISVAVTDESAMWASVSGYYSTHYVFRGLAHLLGHYQLFHRKMTVHLGLENGQFICTFKRGRGREHEWYREVVAADVRFKSDPFFLAPSPGMLDVAHRDRANYVDHLSAFPYLRTVDRDVVRNRMQRIAQIEVQSPPALTLTRFPDVEAVQINAYQRIVRFRQFLDNSLNGSRLWGVHRNPGWAAGFIDFQLIESRGAAQR